MLLLVPIYTHWLGSQLFALKNLEAEVGLGSSEQENEIETTDIHSMQKAS